MCHLCEVRAKARKEDEEIEINLGAIILDFSNRIKELENKAILKPDYNPEEVAFNQVPKEGSFEWAIMQMKKGKRIRREGFSDFTYYMTQLGSLMQIHDDDGELIEDMIAEPDFDMDDILATDWVTIEWNKM